METLIFTHCHGIFIERIVACGVNSVQRSHAEIIELEQKETRSHQPITSTITRYNIHLKFQL